MERIPFATEEERENAVAQQEALGNYLVEEQNLLEGNFLVFEDSPVKTRYRAALRSEALVQHLADASFDDIDSWVDTNVTGIAGAKVLFKKMLVVMSYLLNKEKP